MVASVLPEWNPRLKRFALTDLRRSLPALSGIRVRILEAADEFREAPPVKCAILFLCLNHGTAGISPILHRFLIKSGKIPEM